VLLKSQKLASHLLNQNLGLTQQLPFQVCHRPKYFLVVTPDVFFQIFLSFDEFVELGLLDLYFLDNVFGFSLLNLLLARF